MVSFRSESEILFEKTCDIKPGDEAQFFVGDLLPTESLEIEEVKTFSEFLNTIDFQSPVKWEGGQNLQERNLQNLFYYNLRFIFAIFVKDSDQKKSCFYF